jgi:CheY-like chemotaxis protein
MNHQEKTRAAKNGVILLAEDDDDDYSLTCDAFKESRLPNQVRRVRDGEELMQYLLHRGRYADLRSSPRPSLILLDLNMPRKDGRECLRAIKDSPDLRHIPVVVLTTSQAQEDVIRSYQLGVNSYLRKPAGFQALVDATAVLCRYWFGIVELPSNGH